MRVLAVDFNCAIGYNIRIKSLKEPPIMSFTKDQINLGIHIEQENARHAGSFLSVVTDPAHWAGYDITTIAQYEHYMVAATHTDYYKDVTGIKPRWIDYSAFTVEQIQQMIREVDEQWQGEAEYIAWIDSVDAEKAQFEGKFADPVPTKYEVMAEQAGF